MEIDKGQNRFEKLKEWVENPINAESAFLGSGNDSEIFLIEDCVLKFYSHLSLEQLKMYKEATEKVKKLIDRKRTNEIGFEVFWKVIPIEEIGGPINYPSRSICNLDANYSISKFCLGSNFEDFHKYTYRQLAPDQDISILNKVGGISSLNLILGKMADYLNSNSGFKGINLDMVNVKPYLFKGKNCFYVTDICSSIPSLTRKS